jgi:hypothetical protein
VNHDRWGTHRRIDAQHSALNGRRRGVAVEGFLDCNFVRFLLNATPMLLYAMALHAVPDFPSNPHALLYLPTLSPPRCPKRAGARRAISESLAPKPHETHVLFFNLPLRRRSLRRRVSSMQSFASSITTCEEDLRD